MASRVQLRFSRLLAATGLSAPELRKLLRQEPALFLASPIWLQQQLDDLAAIFNARSLELLRLMAAQPQLLLQPARQLRERMEGAAASLGVEVARVQAVYCRSPALFSWRADTLVSKVQRFAAALQMDCTAVLAMAANSNLLFKEPADVGARWRCLQGCMQQCAMWQDNWAEYMWSTRASLLLRSSPLYSRWVWGARVGVLCVLCLLQAVPGTPVLGPPDAPDMHGWLFNCQCRGMSRCIHAGISTQATQVLPPYQCRHPPTHPLTPASPPHRLDYLLHKGQATSMALSTALTLTVAQFATKHPSYSSWRAQRRRASAASVAPAAATADASNAEGPQQGEEAQQEQASLAEILMQQAEVADPEDFQLPQLPQLLELDLQLAGLQLQQAGEAGSAESSSRAGGEETPAERRARVSGSLRRKEVAGAGAADTGLLLAAAPGSRAGAPGMQQHVAWPWQLDSSSERSSKRPRLAADAPAAPATAAATISHAVAAPASASSKPRARSTGPAQALAEAGSQTAAAAALPRKRGRPRKTTAVQPDSNSSRAATRTPVADSEAAEAPRRRRGRPRKTDIGQQAAQPDDMQLGKALPAAQPEEAAAAAAAAGVRRRKRKSSTSGVPPKLVGNIVPWLLTRRLREAGAGSPELAGKR